MMSWGDLTLSVAYAEPAEAERLAADLYRMLAEEIGSDHLSRRRVDESTQDGGAIVAVAAAVLGTPAVKAFCDGVSAWLARRSQVHLDLKMTLPDGELHEATVTGRLSSGELEQVVRGVFEQP
jgi:Effector Associated Constant Component 1